jgi:hypothetical protein
MPAMGCRLRIVAAHVLQRRSTILNEYVGEINLYAIIVNSVNLAYVS